MERLSTCVKKKKERKKRSNARGEEGRGGQKEGDPVFTRFLPNSTQLFSLRQERLISSNETNEPNNTAERYRGH